MKVTNVKVYRVKGKEKLRATASITLDDVFMVHGLKVIDGQKGLFVVMPAVKKNNLFKDIAHPITAEMRNQIVDAVLQEYNRIVSAEDAKSAEPKTTEEKTN